MPPGLFNEWKFSNCIRTLLCSTVILKYPLSFNEFLLRVWYRITSPASTVRHPNQSWMNIICLGLNQSWTNPERILSVQGQTNPERILNQSYWFVRPPFDYASNTFASVHVLVQQNRSWIKNAWSEQIIYATYHNMSYSACKIHDIYKSIPYQVHPPARFLTYIAWIATKYAIQFGRSIFTDGTIIKDGITYTTKSK